MPRNCLRAAASRNGSATTGPNCTTTCGPPVGATSFDAKCSARNRRRRHSTRNCLEIRFIAGRHALALEGGTALEGRLDIISFLERNFFLPGSWFTHRPIKFENRQTENIIKPVLARDANGRRKYNVFLNGMGKKNGKSTLSAAMLVYTLLLDDESPEIYSVAGDLDQSRIVLRGSKRKPGAPLEPYDVEDLWIAYCRFFYSPCFST